MSRMFESYDGVTEATDVYDQACRNCRWWYADMDINSDPNTEDERNTRKCHRSGSEKKGMKTTPDAWCWAWQRNGGSGGKSRNSRNKTFDNRIAFDDWR